LIVQGYLRPSRELLEFYRRKIAQYDNERDDMIQKLDRCKVAYEEKVLVVVILQTFGFDLFNNKFPNLILSCLLIKIPFSS